MRVAGDPVEYIADLYYVALMKYEYFVSILAGPFPSISDAETAMLNIEDPSGACYMAVVKSETKFESID